MKHFEKIICIFTAAVLWCSSAADAAVISGKSPSARVGESVGIRILKNGYTLNDITPENASDIIVYQNQTVTGADGEYSFDADYKGARSAYVGFADSGKTQKINLAEPKIYYNSDFSDYTGGRGVFSYLRGSQSAFSAYDFGGDHGRVLKAEKDKSSTLFKYIYADESDKNKKLSSGVYRIAFDYYPTESNAEFTFRLLKAKISDYGNGENTFETFAVNSETKLGFYEGAKGWTMHYPFYLQQKNKWYSVVMYVDFELSRIVYYIDNKYFGISELDSTKFTSFDGIAFSAPARADIYLDNMSVVGVNSGYAAQLLSKGTEPSYELSPLRSEIKTKKTGNIFGNGDTIAFSAKYAPYDDLDGVTMLYEVTDESGSVVWSGTKYIGDMKSGMMYDDKVLPTVQKYGIYTLRASAEDSAGITAADETVSFSYVNTAQALNKRFGIVNHIAHNVGEYDKLAETEKQAGFGMVRDELFWSSYEQKKGEYKVPWIYNQYYTALKDSGIELLQLFSATNKLYTNEYPPRSDNAVNAFADYAANLSRDLIGTTNYFEVWNEYNMDSNSVSDYFNMAKTVNEKVKDENPNAKFVGVCAAELDGENKIVPWVTEFLNTVIDKNTGKPTKGSDIKKGGGGGGDYIDALSIHIYCQGKSPESADYVSTIKKIRKLLDDKGFDEMPIWMTETGWSVGTAGISERLRAAYGVRANMLCGQDNLVEKMFWYNSLKKYGESAYEHGLGIMEDVMRENPYAATDAYLAFSNYNALVAGKTQKSLTKASNGVYNVWYEGENESVCAVWADGNEKECSVNIGLEYAEIRDMFGNSTVVKTDNGTLTLTAADSPKYVMIPKIDYKIYCGGMEIKRLSDIENIADATLEISAAVNRTAIKATEETGKAALICAAYKDGMLTDVSVCADKNSGSGDYACFETKINATDADRVAVFVRGKGLVKPIDKYEIEY